jgi:flagellar biosynthetic protein FlhB
LEHPVAEESDLEKTEPASPRRLEQAREEGDVPRSRELATCTVLLAAGGGLWLAGDGVARSLSRFLAASLTWERELAYDPAALLQRLGTALADLLLAFAPFGALMMVAALAAPLAIGGWNVSGKALGPKFGRMNPLQGLSNMISVRALVELAKAIGKTLLVGWVSWIVIGGQIESMLGLVAEPVGESSGHLAHMLLVSFLSIAGALALIAAIDAPYQLWQHGNKLKMSRQDVRQENKESEGNPEIKGRIRAQQREMARRRMMAEVPGADVVVTNPTHYAVALKYTEGKMRAPTVVAKGADAVAARIREIAAEHRVTLLEAPPLARALYRHAELGDEIPAALYNAVAQVLAYVFQLRAYASQGGVPPQVPRELDVPAALDPSQAGADKAAP